MKFNPTLPLMSVLVMSLSQVRSAEYILPVTMSGLYPGVLGKGPWLKLGEIIDKIRKKYQNQEQGLSSATVFCHNMKP